MDSSPHPSGLTDDQIVLLRTAAEAVAAHAYAPYSKFRVGAAVLLDDGTVFSGCNVENASYGFTSCAERNAIFAAVADRGPAISLRAVFVTNLNHAASMPCGACRQVLTEFGTSSTWVFFPGTDGPAAAPLSALLPYVFKLAHDG